MIQFSKTALLAAILAIAACEEEKRGPTPMTAAETAKAAAEAAAKETKAKEAQKAEVDAYIYGYPLVTMEMTRRISTNVAAPEGTRAPMGQFAKLREYPSAAFRDITAPNADTLYTVLWLDVSKEPWVVSFPDMKGRYFLMPMLDGWTTVFADPGKRTTGTKAQTYAITGPGWKGTLPAGITEHKSATGMVWLLGRIYSSGTPADYKDVHKLQDACSAVPLSSYGKAYAPAPGKIDPAIDMKTAVREQVNRMDAASYFELLATLMKDNPPTAADADMVGNLARMGVVAGKAFDATKLDPIVAKGLLDVPKLAQQKIMGWFKAGVAAGDARFENGWLFTLKTGTYGTNYLQRALVTAVGLGANLPQDAVYPTSEGAADGKPYSGANKYVMHFDKGKLPPADGFWSLTMYDAQFFFVANPLNRYDVSSRSKFKANKDGSIDVLIQKDPPPKSWEENWLPAPPDKFIVMLRLYWPKEKPPSILDGTWAIPAVAIAPAPAKGRSVEGGQE